jgi:hypothetical protein
VEATAQDVLKGIVFYLACCCRFPFFLERLIFGFPDIRKQIAYAFVMFLAVFWGISPCAPRFRIGPYAIHYFVGVHHSGADGCGDDVLVEQV